MIWSKGRISNSNRLALVMQHLLWRGPWHDKTNPTPNSIAEDQVIIACLCELHMVRFIIRIYKTSDNEYWRPRPAHADVMLVSAYTVCMWNKVGLLGVKTGEYMNNISITNDVGTTHSRWYMAFKQRRSNVMTLHKTLHRHWFDVVLTVCARWAVPYPEDANLGILLRYCIFWWGSSHTTVVVQSTLREQAYSNILKILPPKKWKFSDEKF